MKLATWNVNSLKVRLPQVIDWLGANKPDILCLQETKLSDDNFPTSEIAAIGYQSAFIGQKTYNGVAILSKQEGSEVISAIPGFADEQKKGNRGNLWGFACYFGVCSEWGYCFVGEIWLQIEVVTCFERMAAAGAGSSFKIGGIG